MVRCRASAVSDTAQVCERYVGLYERAQAMSRWTMIRLWAFDTLYRFAPCGCWSASGRCVGRWAALHAWRIRSEAGG